MHGFSHRRGWGEEYTQFLPKKKKCTFCELYTSMLQHEHCAEYLQQLRLTKPQGQPSIRNVRTATPSRPFDNTHQLRVATQRHATFHRVIDFPNIGLTERTQLPAPFPPRRVSVPRVHQNGASMSTDHHQQAVLVSFMAWAVQTFEPFRLPRQELTPDFFFKRR